MSTDRRVVADEHHLRIALKQQLLHNEQQNLAMTRMTRKLNSTERLLKDITKLNTKVLEEGMIYEAYYENVTELVSKFKRTNTRCNKGTK